MGNAEAMKEAAGAMATQGMATGISMMSRMLEGMQKSMAPDGAAANPPNTVSPPPQKP